MDHSDFMKLALDLADKGFPMAMPNPVVGCVIVHNGNVVAEGYHQHFGGPHAEVNAVAALPAGIDPGGCTLYVTLEPCAHHGKTPPCAEMLAAKKFGTVVIAAKDPNPLVCGKGLEILEKTGIKVVTGVMEREAREQNRRFFTFYEKRRPYIIIKWAQTADGFISKIPVPSTRAENMITRAEAQAYSHRLRAQSMAVMVGKRTVQNDDPALTTRLVAGANPLRIFIDRNLEVPKKYKVYNTEAETIVFNSLKEQGEANVRFVQLDFEKNLLEQICDRLYHLNVQSLLVEGGAKLVTGFVKGDLWDEVLVFENPDLRFYQGLKAPEFAIKNSFELVGEDKLFHHFKNETITTGKALEI